MGGLLSIFFAFLKIGAVTFGGGYSIMPVLERELVNSRGWLTMDEVVDYYTIGQITPGMIAVNMASFVGYKRKKTSGAIVATVGFIIPGITLVTLAALLLQNFSGIPIVRNAFAGIRLVVCALIVKTIAGLTASLIQRRRRPLQNAAAAAIFAVCLASSLAWNVNPVLLAAVSGLTGFFCFFRGGNVHSDDQVR